MPKLGARILRDVANVNVFRVAERGAFTEGDTVNVYFQLMDQSVDLPTEGFNPPYRRFVPAAGATLSVVLESLDMDKKVTRSCTQPFSQDPSIWMLSVLNTDKIRGTVTMSLVLTQSGVATRGRLQPALDVLPLGMK